MPSALKARRSFSFRGPFGPRRPWRVLEGLATPLLHALPCCHRRDAVHKNTHNSALPCCHRRDAVHKNTYNSALPCCHQRDAVHETQMSQSPAALSSWSAAAASVSDSPSAGSSSASPSSSAPSAKSLSPTCTNICFLAIGALNSKRGSHH